MSEEKNTSSNGLKLILKEYQEIWCYKMQFLLGQNGVGMNYILEKIVHNMRTTNLPMTRICNFHIYSGKNRLETYVPLSRQY